MRVEPVRLLCLCVVSLPYAVVTPASSTYAAGQPRWTWRRLPDLPDPLGVAGAFAGETGGAAIVAGGANFPDAPPWRGGRKACHATIHVLVANVEQSRDGYRWLANAGSLPHPLSYGVSVTTNRGVLIIGGCDAARCYADVYRVRWSAERGVETETLPPLPRPLAYMTGAKVGDSIYVAGGQETVADPRATSHFFRLDLTKEGSPQFAWQQLPSWPGPSRVVAVSCGSGNGADAGFYLFSGRDLQPGKIPQPLSDAYRYRVATGQWETLPPIRPEDASAEARCVMGATAIASGSHTIDLLGGDDGVSFTALERLRRQIASATDASVRTALEAKLRDILVNHRGFSRDVVQYDTAAGRYLVGGAMPQPPPVTTPCVPWRGGLLLPSGEIRPGVRSPAVWLGRATTRRQ